MLKKENIVFLLFSVMSVLLSLISIYILSNYFSIEDFGKIQLLLTFIGFFSIFSLSGFDIVIQKSIFNKQDNIVNYILKNVMPKSFLLFVVICISIYFFTDYKDLLVPLFLIVSLALFDKTTAILNAKLTFKYLRYIELITKMVLFLLALTTIAFNLNIMNYIFIFTFLTVAMILIRIYMSNKLLVCNNIDKDYDKVIHDGYKTSFSSAYTIIANWSEKLFLGFIDPKILAVFVIGQLFPKVLKDNVKILLTPTLNVWASKGFIHYKKMIELYKLPLWLFGIGLYLLTYFLVDFVISNYFVKYEESIIVAQILAIPLIFKFVITLKMSAMSLSEYTYVFNKINNINNTIKLILISFLIPMFGINGAVSAIVITEVVHFLLITMEFKKYRGLNSGI